MRAQWQRNQETALSWRIKQARLPEQWSLGSLQEQKGVDRIRPANRVSSVG